MGMWEGDLIKEFLSADGQNSLVGSAILFQDQVHIDRIHLGDELETRSRELLEAAEAKSDDMFVRVAFRSKFWSCQEGSHSRTNVTEASTMGRFSSHTFGLGDRQAIEDDRYSSWVSPDPRQNDGSRQSAPRLPAEKQQL